MKPVPNPVAPLALRYRMWAEVDVLEAEATYVHDGRRFTASAYMEGATAVAKSFRNQPEMDAAIEAQITPALLAQLTAQVAAFNRDTQPVDNTGPWEAECRRIEAEVRLFIGEEGTPFFVSPHVGKLCQERYGRIPAGIVVRDRLIVGGFDWAPTRTITRGEAVRIYPPRVTTDKQALEGPGPYIGESRRKGKAQWKRERSGRR